MPGRSRLGKGLGALFPSLDDAEPQANGVDAVSVEAADSAALSVKKSDKKSASSSTSSSTSSTTTSGITKASAANKASSTTSTTASTTTTKNVSRETSSKKSGGTQTKRESSSRPRIPSLAQSVSPSDMFFGLDTPSVSTTSQTEPIPSENLQQLKPVEGAYLTEINLSDIVANEHQPRQIFDEDDLIELSKSITEVGVLQPVVVREVDPLTHDGAHYELIMGERRTRASRLAHKETIPAIVKTTADDDMLRDALLENLHRVALNPLEEAAAYQQMIKEFGMTQEQLAKSVSKSRPQITNTLRLLQLPAGVQKHVASGVLSAGHARALLSLDTAEEMTSLAHRIVAEGLSVRSTEEIVAMAALGEKPSKSSRNRSNPWQDSEIIPRLENHFETQVKIKGTQKRGRIEITFTSYEDLTRIVNLIDRTHDTAGTTSDGWM